MFRKRLEIWLIAAALIALPLLWSDTAQAESGCHRSGGSGSMVSSTKG